MSSMNKDFFHLGNIGGKDIIGEVQWNKARKEMRGELEVTEVPMNLNHPEVLIPYFSDEILKKELNKSMESNNPELSNLLRKEYMLRQVRKRSRIRDKWISWMSLEITGLTKWNMWNMQDKADSKGWKYNWRRVESLR